MSSRDTIDLVRKTFTGRVRDGVIVIDGVSLSEGASVTVSADVHDVLPDDDNYVYFDQNGDLRFSPAAEAELEESIAEADRGELVSWESVWADLQRSRPR